MPANVRRLRVDDAPALVALRREALESEPLAFSASVEDDRGLSLDFARTILADETQAIFGAFQDANLVGLVGVLRASKLKRRHTAELWGMYVGSGARNAGVGRALLDAAVAHARAWDVLQLRLSVSDAAPAAKQLYEAAGFCTWGREPRALEWQGRFVDEHHLWLDLRAQDRRSPSR